MLDDWHLGKHDGGMSTDVQHSGSLSDRVAEEIRALLARKRMTGRELARRLGVSPSWISYRLTGTQPIDFNDAARIAEALDVPVVALLPADHRETGATRRYPHTSDPLASRLVATVGQPNGRQRPARIGRGRHAVRLPRPGIVLRRRPVTPAVR